MTEVKVELPFHLCTLAGIAGREVLLAVPEAASAAALVAALEARFPALRGTVREYGTGERRAYLRFFACGQDISFDPMDAPLPAEVLRGVEPFIILGAVSGG